jgi:hypothetical protein
VTEFDVKRDLESFSTEFNWFRVLLDVIALDIFNLESDLRVELLFLLGSKCNLNGLIFARLDCPTGLRNDKFLRKSFNA